jgi:hypothetical protein
VPEGILPETGGRMAPVPEVPRPAQYAVLLTDAAVCAPIRHDGQPPRVHPDNSLCNGLAWHDLPPTNPAARLLPLVNSLPIVEFNRQPLYRDLLALKGRDRTDLLYILPDLAPAGWHFATREAAERFAVLLLSAMPSRVVQPPGERSVPVGTARVFGRMPELPGQGPGTVGGSAR